MDIISVITVISFILFIFVLLFTSQGQELKENVEYGIKRFVTKAKNIKTKPKLYASADKSKFIRDVTIPDGTKVKVNQKFTKIWEIQNVGSIIWDNRYLQREGPSEGPGRLKSKDRVRTPYTEPGQRVKVKIIFVAPSGPGSCYCEWKMVDDKGNYLLPNQKPLYISIDVTY